MRSRPSDVRKPSTDGRDSDTLKTRHSRAYESDCARPATKNRLDWRQVGYRRQFAAKKAAAAADDVIRGVDDLSEARKRNRPRSRAGGGGGAGCDGQQPQMQVRHNGMGVETRWLESVRHRTEVFNLNIYYTFLYVPWR